MRSMLRQTQRHIFIVISLLIFLLIFFGKSVLVVRSFILSTGLTPIALYKLVFDTGAELNPINGRVNVALLGIGGGNHEGADLTDTILILSFNLKKQTLGMISVPRDIWSDTLKDKVNSAYHYGEVKKKGGGLILSKAVISDMVGLPIQYGIVFDFVKFQHIIDIVGGITIDVPETFTDKQYPVDGTDVYMAVTFKKGIQTMNGVRALQYVRSRHAEGVEGSDFARSRRQQQVIVALKNKLWNPQQFLSLSKAFDNATDTDMNIVQSASLGKLFVRIPQEQITHIAIDDALYSPPEGWYGRSVLLPKDSFEAIHELILQSLRTQDR